MKVVVATVAHRGDDARIVHRESRSLIEAGHQVTLVAPDIDEEARGSDPPGLMRVALPRATGRRRLGAWRALRRRLRQVARDAHVIVIHDPELVPVVGWWRRGWRQASLLWDVHEDYVASVASRTYLPRRVQPVVTAVVAVVERWARRRFHLLLAEDAYARRLGDAVVVPNSTWVPDQVAPFELPARVVYVGRISNGRGVDTMIAVGRALRATGREITVEVIGAADREVEPRLRAAHDAGEVRWLGPIANPEALSRVRGALAGLSLLHDEANYRHSRPTKAVEYLAHGVPVITTPLPLAADLVNRSGAGVVTSGFSGATVVDEVVAAVLHWCDDTAQRSAQGEAGHRHVRAHHSWQRDGQRFVDVLEGYASAAR